MLELEEEKKAARGFLPRAAFLFLDFTVYCTDMMSRSIMIIILALLTALFPHLGFPGQIKHIAVTLLSLGIALLGYMAYRAARAHSVSEQYKEGSFPSHKKDSSDTYQSEG